MDLVTDSSVLLKWFITEQESEVDAAAALLRAHRLQLVRVILLDLTIYELGNNLVRRLDAATAADRLDDIVLLCGPVISLEPEWRRDAAQLAERHRLTFYDAAFAAAARGLGVSLVSADRQLLAAGLAESVTEFARRLRLV